MRGHPEARCQFTTEHSASLDLERLVHGPPENPHGYFITEGDSGPVGILLGTP